MTYTAVVSTGAVIPMAFFDFRKEEDVRAYLDNLYAEYSFSCYKENKPDSCHLLGDYYESINVDKQKAIELWKTNCEQNSHARSCHKYAFQLLQGNIVPEDTDKAYEVFQKACHLNPPYYSSCHLLAKMCSIGTQKYPKDVTKALKYLDQVCDSGNADACFEASAKYIKGKDVEKDMKKGLEYSIKACNLELYPACVNVSRMLSIGDGVPKDVTLAEKFKLRSKAIKDSLKEKVEFTGSS